MLESVAIRELAARRERLEAYQEQGAIRIRRQL